MAKQIHRKRKAKLGITENLPRVWSEYEVPAMYKVTITGERFLIMDELTEIGERIWGFMSPSSIGIAKGCSHLFVDGTFEIVKKCLFTQLWMIVGRSEFNKLTVPLGYFLLPNKLQATYRKVLKRLKELGVDKVDVFHCDFEAGAMKAIRLEYPAAQVEGCDTHWKRALRSAQARCGLLKFSDD